MREGWISETVSPGRAGMRLETVGRRNSKSSGLALHQSSTPCGLSSLNPESQALESCLLAAAGSSLALKSKGMSPIFS